MNDDIMSYEFDFLSVDPCVAVMEAMSQLTGQSEIDLPPLYRAVDPDALNTICGDTNSESTYPNTVSFVYTSVHVTVRGDGVVFLDEEVEQ